MCYQASVLAIEKHPECMQLPVLDTRHSHSLGVNVLVCVELSLDSIGSSGYKEISFIKIDQGGP